VVNDFKLPVRWWVAVLAALLIAGCLGCSREIPADTVVNGWSIGAEDSYCTSTHIREATADCQDRLAVAIAGLDRRNPGHPGVVRVTVHHEGRYRDSSGSLKFLTRSFGVDIAVFELGDRSFMALGVGRPGPGGLSVFDYGPDGKITW
jgi:hypothetical protein